MKNTDYKKLWRKSKDLIAQQHNTLNSISLVLEALTTDKEVGDKVQKLVGEAVISNQKVMLEENTRLGELFLKNEL